MTSDHDRPRRPAAVVLTGAAVLSAFGRGIDRPGRRPGRRLRRRSHPVHRFDVSGRRVGVAAAMPGSPELRTDETGCVDDSLLTRPG